MIRAWFNHLRFRMTAAYRAPQYFLNYLDRAYRIYLNHNRIIHYRQGHPVYSLSTPPAFSKAAANMFARQIFSVIQNRSFPNLLSFAVNDICNANCYHCSFFGGGVAEPGRHVMTTEECKKTLRDAQELGVSVINFVGGEPTLRDDLPEILSAVDKDLATTVMFTNGLILERKIRTLKAAGLDSVFVSIDSADPKINDEKRGIPGLFVKAMDGFRKAKSLGMSVGLSLSVTPDDFRSGELDRVVELGRTIGAHEIVVFDIMPTGRMSGHDELVDNESWIEEMITRTKKWNDDPRYPVVTLYAYSTSFRSAGCSCGISYFYVSPYGDVNPCDFNHKHLGNVLEQPLWKIWDKMTKLEDYRQAKWGGCKIKDSDLRARGVAVADGAGDRQANAIPCADHHVAGVIEKIKEYERTQTL